MKDKGFKMNNQQLQSLVEQISLKDFGKPFQHQATFNPRLRTTGGRYLLKTHAIEINPKMLTEFSKATLIGVIKHELCHYHLHLAGLSGRHNTRAFKTLLKRVGGSRYAPKPKHWHTYQYRCERCGHIYRRRRRINVKLYVCSLCHGHLKPFQTGVKHG